MKVFTGVTDKTFGPHVFHNLKIRSKRRDNFGDLRVIQSEFWIQLIRQLNDVYFKESKVRVDKL